jgi:thiamine-monophosphate kinase
VLLGIGDDCAAVRAEGVAFTSLDMVVEGVHFRAGWLSDREIGWRAVAAAASDLAAMAVAAGEVYLGLGLPAGFGEERAVALVRGAKALADRCGLTIAGGDVVSAPVLTVAVTVVGWASQLHDALRRRGAKAGQLAAVTGRLGGAAAAVRFLASGGSREELDRYEAGGVWARPQPRLEAAKRLKAAGATALIDLSDGLAADGLQLAIGAGLTLEVDLWRLPLVEGVEELAQAVGEDPHTVGASGGEDYELLCALPADRFAAAQRALAKVGVPLTAVGRFVEGEPVVRFRRLDGTTVALRGFEHSF